MAVFWDIVLRVALALIFVVINSIIIQFVSAKLNLSEKGFDNSTTVAIVLGTLLLVVSYMPRWKIIFMLLGGTILPIILMKELYKIPWKKTFHFWLEWFLLYILVIVLMTIGFLLLF